MMSQQIRLSSSVQPIQLQQFNMINSQSLDSRTVSLRPYPQQQTRSMSTAPKVNIQIVQAVRRPTQFNPFVLNLEQVAIQQMQQPATQLNRPTIQRQTNQQIHILPHQQQSHLNRFRGRK